MRKTLAAALAATVCVAELSVQGITASDSSEYLAILRENWEPEYQQYYKDAIAESGITFAAFEAKIEEAKDRHKSRKVRMQRRRNRTIVCRNSERSSSPTASCA